MAANWKSSQGIAASLGKRVVDQIWTSSPARSSPSSSLRRAAHASAYDKNLDEHVRPTIVPDDVINPESDKYWSPHPQTGVFGPATDHTHAAGSASASAGNGQSSVLEENAWFRPSSLEDLEKPHHS